MLSDPVLLNQWHPIGRSDQLAEGQVTAARLLGEDLVIWRSNGQIQVWQDLCIHRGAKLSPGKICNGQLVCPYHGWRYRADGSCALIPAHPEQSPPPRAKARVYASAERYGLIWACLGTPAQPLFEFPEFEDASFRVIPCGPYPVRASAPRLVENGLDVAHFAFVHEGYLGDADHAEIPDYVVATDDSGICAKDIRFWQKNPDGTGVPGYVSYTYWVPRPLVTLVRKTSTGPVFALLHPVTPVDEFHSIGWICLAMNYGHEVPLADIWSFQDTVYLQDVPVVESQHPELLPLDLQEELHLRCDRTSIAYRQWLKQIGVGLGTS